MATYQTAESESSLADESEISQAAASEVSQAAASESCQADAASESSLGANKSRLSTEERIDNPCDNPVAGPSGEGREEEQQSGMDDVLTPLLKSARIASPHRSYVAPINTDYAATYNIVMHGGPDVGKTSLVRRFVERRFNPREVTTLNAEFTVRLAPDRRVRVFLTDISGCSSLRTVYGHGVRSAHGVVLVYDVTSVFTYKQMKSLCRRMLRFNVCPSLIFIVGAKYDIEDQRVVPFSKAEDIAEKLGTRAFQTSALNGMGVEEMFLTVVRTIDERRSRFEPPAPEDRGFWRNFCKKCLCCCA